jgi:(2Fe-2S) ferredoxin
MRKHERSFASAVSAKLLAAVIVTIAHHPAFAADTCLTKPNLQADQGGHWYYRVDRVNHRRCWYQQASGMQVPGAESLPASPPPTARPQPSFSSWLASIAAAITGASSTGAEQDFTNRESRVVQAPPMGTLTQRSRAEGRVEPADASIKRVEARDSRGAESKAAPTPLLAQERLTQERLAQ